MGEIEGMTWEGCCWWASKNKSNDAFFDKRRFGGEYDNDMWCHAEEGCISVGRINGVGREFVWIVKKDDDGGA